MKCLIILWFLVMFGIVLLFVFMLVGCGLFVMMECQLFVELCVMIDMCVKVVQMIVLYVIMVVCGCLMQEKFVDFELFDGLMYYQVISDNFVFCFGSFVDGVLFDLLFGVFQCYQFNDSSYVVMMKIIMLVGVGEWLML